MAIAEALSFGVPTLTTTGAPWSVLQTHQCGWWVTPTADAITDALRHACSLSCKELLAMGERGRRLIENEYDWDRVARRMIRLYEDCLRGAPTPT
jgi:glycosyltransferase involved in cell wall biosynthesis